MMRDFRKIPFDKLVHERAEVAVSLFMPTHESGPETRENAIRYKNLLAEAVKRLERYRERTGKEYELPGEAYDLVEDTDFWRYAESGLALLAGPEFFETYRVPCRLEERVEVKDHYCIKPLLPLENRGQRFWVLTLSQNKSRLYAATAHTIEAVDVPDMPEHIEAWRRYEENRKQLQFHTSSSTQGRGEQQAMFHGQGNVGDKDKQRSDVREFFHWVAKSCENYLLDQRDPLILCGAEENTALFREIVHYGELMEKRVEGNCDHMKEGEILERVRPLIEDYYEKRVGPVVANYHNLKSSQKTMAELKAILMAVTRGRIDTLLAAEEATVWGKLDLDQEEVEIHKGREEDDVDLLDEACFYTMKNGGKVWVLEQERMPDGLPVAAITRY